MYATLSEVPEDTWLTGKDMAKILDIPYHKWSYLLKTGRGPRRRSVHARLDLFCMADVNRWRTAYTTKGYKVLLEGTELVIFAQKYYDPVKRAQAALANIKSRKQGTACDE